MGGVVGPAVCVLLLIECCDVAECYYAVLFEPSDHVLSDVDCVFNYV